LTVVDEDASQLRWDRDCPCGAVGLGRSEVPLPVDLVCELDLGVVEVVDADVRPGEGEQFGQPCSAESSDREQGAVGLVGGCDRLLKLTALEDAAALPLRRLRPLGGQHQGDRVHADPTQTSGGIPIDPVRHADDDHDRRFGEPLDA
jgi:hypothetical protein